ncbi:MAG: hypothetical protein ACE5GC_04425 [Acidimicrobiia bacterium]
MRDPTWADTVVAAVVISWVLFVVFGGLAALGWRLGGLASTHPGSSAVTRAQREAAQRRSKGSKPDAAASRGTVRTGDYLVYDDPDSAMQVLEDDREWHHDRRRCEGHIVCPECGTRLRSATPCHTAPPEDE